MPTDDVMTLIADLRAKAAAMPSGPYGVDFYHPLNHPTIHTVCAGRAYLDQRKHMNYFAALDPALVRALLDVVEADIAFCAAHRAYMDALLADETIRIGSEALNALGDAADTAGLKHDAAHDALEALAADRVAS